MAKRRFEFVLYRLNIVPENLSLFDRRPTRIRDGDILKILEKATAPDFKIEIESMKHVYRWAVRDFFVYEHDRANAIDFAGITLAKSTAETRGEIVTDKGIIQGRSEFEPPIADTIHMFFRLDRHLVAVERSSSILASERWRLALEDILKAAAETLKYRGRIVLEPVPKAEELLKAFRSFSRLTRLRVTLRLPNPELSRYSKQLYEEMENGAIAEYLQDMRNPNGLSKEPEHLPHASAEIAQGGYKKGPVRMEGVRDGRRESVQTGTDAAKGTIDDLKEYVRGINSIAKTKEGRRIAASILNEMDRIAPPPETQQQ